MSHFSAVEVPEYRATNFLLENAHSRHVFVSTVSLYPPNSSCSLRTAILLSPRWSIDKSLNESRACACTFHYLFYFFVPFASKQIRKLKRSHCTHARACSTTCRNHFYFNYHSDTVDGSVGYFFSLNWNGSERGRDRAKAILVFHLTFSRGTDHHRRRWMCVCHK